MIRKILFALCSAALTILSDALWQESDTTTWTGTLDAAGAILKLEITLTEADGEFTGQLLSLDQNNATFELADVVCDDQQLTFTIEKLGATFNGTLEQDGTIAQGTFSQNGFEFPLKLSLANSADKITTDEPVEKLQAAWYGKLQMGTVNPVMQFRILVDESGKTTAYFDSVTEGRTDFEASWSIEGDKLEFDVEKIRLTYRGSLNEAGDTAEGTWSQGGRSYPLTLKKHHKEYSP